MSASADIQTKTHENVLSVPINAVTTREKNDSLKTKIINADNTNKTASVTDDDLDVVVFVLQKEGTVKKVNVKTDIQDINNIEITEGVKEGDEIITGPYDMVSKKLKEKDKVKVVDKKLLFDMK